MMISTPLTALTLLSSLGASPAPGRGRDTALGHRLPDGAPVAAGQQIQAPSQAGRSVLTRGRCLLRLSAGARIRLHGPAPGTRCPEVTLLGGELQILAPRGRGPALRLRLGGRAVRWHDGEGRARRRAGVRGLCLRRGRVTVTATARGASPGTRPPETKARARSVSGPGRCLWIATDGGLTVSRARRDDRGDAKGAAPRGSPYAFPTPALPLTLDLRTEVDALGSRARGRVAGGAEVEGGGQSMCLETGGEGSAADLGGTSVDVTKAPPATHLRLHIDIRRRTP